MAINFPNTPADKQRFTDTNGKVWEYETATNSWTIVGSSSDYWDRTGTELSPKTAGDVVSVSAGTAALPGLTPVGDPNTGIYSPGADQLAISTNGIERVTVDSVGRLLVGATSVSSSASGAVEVVKGPNVTAQSGQGQISVLTSNAQAANIGGSIQLGGQSTAADWPYATIAGRSENNGYAGYLAVGTSGLAGAHAERARIDSSGDFLLGGTLPASPNITLKASGEIISSKAVRAGVDASGVSLYAPGAIRDTGTATNMYFDVASGGAAHGKFIFRSSSAYTERAFITETGNFVIGGNILAGTFVPVAGSTARIQSTNTANFANTAVFADNTAAKAGGLVDGDIYRTATGQLMIVFT
jgi:hypothetical protein